MPWSLQPDPALLPPTSPHRQCAHCTRPGTKRCSRCKKVWYCSQACQRKQWPLHKEICYAPNSQLLNIVHFPPHTIARLSNWEWEIVNENVSFVSSSPSATAKDLVATGLHRDFAPL